MAQVRHLKLLPGGYNFKIAAARDDYKRVVDELVKKVPSGLLKYERDKTWTVGNRFEDLLGRLFFNFTAELNRIRSQDTLF